MLRPQGSRLFVPAKSLIEQFLHAILQYSAFVAAGNAYSLQISRSPPRTDGTPQKNMEKEIRSPAEYDQEKENKRDRYPTLQTLSKSCRLFAMLSGIIGVILVFVGLSSSASSSFLFLGGVASLTLGVVINLAMAEGIRLLIDIENNTRKTYEQFAQQAE